MKCPNCGYDESTVYDSRNTDKLNSIRRRRKCLKCNHTFTTYETVARPIATVVHSTRYRENYNPNILFDSIALAARNRPIQFSEIRDIMIKVEESTIKQSSLISTQDIINIVSEQLKKMDYIAYVRYAAGYKTFIEAPENKELEKEN